MQLLSKLANCDIGSKVFGDWSLDRFTIRELPDENRPGCTKIATIVKAPGAWFQIEYAGDYSPKFGWQSEGQGKKTFRGCITEVRLADAAEAVNTIVNDALAARGRSFP